MGPIDDAGMQPDKEGGGYCIEIYVGPGNKVQTVKVEQKAGSQLNDHDDYGEAPEDMGQPSHDEGRPVGSIEEALQAAMRIYQSGGDMQGQESPEDAATRGYAGPSGMRRGVGLRKVFSEGM